MDYTRLIKVTITKEELFLNSLEDMDFILSLRGIDTHKAYLVLHTDRAAWDIIGWPLRDMSMLIETTYADHQSV